MAKRDSFSLAKILIVIGVLLLGMFVTLIAVSKPIPASPRAACIDFGCTNIKNGSYWMIINCQSTDPDGDQQLCSWVGRVGQCGGVNYCCPTVGARWTTNMSACPTPTFTPTPTNTPTNIPTRTPTPTPSRTPTPTPTRTPTPTPSRTPTPTPTKKPTPTPTKYTSGGTSIKTPTPTANQQGGLLTSGTPMPTNYILNYCNKSCSTNDDCPSGLMCAGGNVFGIGKSCRNTYCSDRFSCICGDSGISGNLNLISPTPESGLTGGGPSIALTVSSFTNSQGLSSSRPTISGTTVAGAKVTVSVLPDGVSGEVTADGAGRWSWRPDKPLSEGKKSLLVVARKDGGQGQVTQSFTAPISAKGFSFGWIIIILVIVALSFGGYVYYKSL